MVQFKVKTSAVYITISQIMTHHNTRTANELIQNLFPSEVMASQPYCAWENSDTLNAHLHCIWVFSERQTITRRTFQRLNALFGTGSLNIETMKLGKTYRELTTGNSYKGGKAGFPLWVSEKIIYCWCDKPEHEAYYEKDKFNQKRKTVVLTCQPDDKSYYFAVIAKWDAFLNSKTDKIKTPKEVICSAIQRDYITVSQYDEYCDGKDSPWNMKTKWYALEHYDKLTKVIVKLAEIRATRINARLYKSKTEGYRPFQASLKGILDTQSDRNIHCHVDSGRTGKNTFVDVESLRRDTLILQNAETKRIAYAWDPLVHKRIIFDIPRGKMQYVNTSVIEKLKNGTLFSTMHHPKMKKSTFKPSILILGNECVDDKWTDDRLTCSTTTRPEFIIKEETREALELKFNNQNKGCF